MASTLKTLDNIEAGVTLNFQQLLTILAEARLEVVAIEQAKKEEPKAEPKCANCGSTDHVEPSCWAQKGKMSLLCYLCELEAEHSFYDAEATEVINEGSI